MQGKPSEALEGLLGLEKQQRLAEDITGTKMACTAILTILREAGDWKGLNEHILLLAKRRSQLKQVSPPVPAGSAVRARPRQRTAAPLQPRRTFRSAARHACVLTRLQLPAACCGGGSPLAAVCRLCRHLSGGSAGICCRCCPYALQLFARQAMGSTGYHQPPPITCHCRPCQAMWS